MATMNDYTLYCTEEQTKKALELGAPIMKINTLTPPDWFDNKYDFQFTLDNNTVAIPTAEQMIGWMEKHKDILVIIDIPFEMWRFDVYYKNEWRYGDEAVNFNTRKEATLAAIDAALDYLTQNKK